MCLITTQQQPLIAEEDITVYKGLDYGMYAPYNIGFKYKLGKPAMVEMEEDDDFCPADQIVTDWLEQEFEMQYRTLCDKYKELGLKVIGRGLHSALSLERAKRHGDEHYKGIVPKGALYYLDGTGLIVSDQLILKEIADGTVAQPAESIFNG